MDDGEVELSDHALLSLPDSSTHFPNSASSVDLFLDDILKNTRTCTHTHTCNPPGPDESSHTHTCYHTHTTRVVSSEEGDSQDKHPSKKSKRPSGNREAVRKYREKKKAHTAYLEEEVKKLQLLNQQLVRKLQGQGILESEIVRLRGLLLDLRGRIDKELGAYPFQKLFNSSNMLNESDCGVTCETDLPCFHPHDVSLTSQAQPGIAGTGKTSVSWGGSCQRTSMECGIKMGDNTVSPNGHSIDQTETLVSSASQGK